MYCTTLTQTVLMILLLLAKILLAITIVTIAYYEQ